MTPAPWSTVPGANVRGAGAGPSSGHVATLLVDHSSARRIGGNLGVVVGGVLVQSTLSHSAQDGHVLKRRLPQARVFIRPHELQDWGISRMLALGYWRRQQSRRLPERTLEARVQNARRCAASSWAFLPFRLAVLPPRPAQRKSTKMWASLSGSWRRRSCFSQSMRWPPDRSSRRSAATTLAPNSSRPSAG